MTCDLFFSVWSGGCCVPKRSLLYHRDYTFFIIKHRTCHSALHLLIIHAIMRYFYTIILFLLHTLIIVKALGSMHILRNQHFPNSWPPSPYKKSIFMHWRKWVTDCDLVLKINKLIHALEKTGHKLWPGLKNQLINSKISKKKFGDPGHCIRIHIPTKNLENMHLRANFDSKKSKLIGQEGRVNSRQ